MRNISKNKYNQILFVDESGTLALTGGRFFSIGIVRFYSYKDFRHWERIAKDTIIRNTDLQRYNEVKWALMNTSLIKKVFKRITTKNIKFDVWCALIDTSHNNYQRKYIGPTLETEKAFNDTLDKIIQEHIVQMSTSLHSIYIDERPQGKEKYIFTQDNANIVQYVQSNTNYGIQFADLLVGTIRQRYNYSENLYTGIKPKDYESVVHIFDTYIKPNLKHLYIYPNVTRNHHP